jgi:meso-butanediol dehydrogenase/(S,S)-butanediol dehydrogenase/diacetyl reductase
VVVADLDLDAARKVEAGLPDGSGRHLALMMDVTNRSSVDEAVAQAVDEFGGLDVVVNVAGGDTAHGVFEETGDDIMAQATGAESGWGCARAALRSRFCEAATTRRRS